MSADGSNKKMNKSIVKLALLPNGGKFATHEGGVRKPDKHESSFSVKWLPDLARTEFDPRRLVMMLMLT